MSDLVRMPDCPTCQRPMWHAPVCRCSHSYVVHDVNSRNERTKCLTMDGSGQCGCRRFEEAAGDG